MKKGVKKAVKVPGKFAAFSSFLGWERVLKTEKSKHVKIVHFKGTPVNVDRHARGKDRDKEDAKN